MNVLIILCKIFQNFFSKSFANVKNGCIFAPSFAGNDERKQKEMYRWPVRLVGLGRKVFILEIRGSNPLRATKKLNFRNGKPQIS